MRYLKNPRSVIEGVVAFAIHTFIAVGGLSLTGIAADRSVITVVAGLAATLAFSRFTYLGPRGRRGYLLGVSAATTIYPALYAIIDNADAGAVGFGLAAGFFASFTIRYVYVPVAALMISVMAAAGLGVIVRELLILPQRTARD